MPSNTSPTVEKNTSGIRYAVRSSFFDLANDRQELHDRANGSGICRPLLRSGATAFIAYLGKRGDGFSDGEKLLVRPEGYGPAAERPAIS